MAAPAPVVILVEPQLGENIGAAARVMANFGLSRLRLVKPTRRLAQPAGATHRRSGADRMLDEAAAVTTPSTAAIADCTFVLATTARAHDQAKPVIGPDEAAACWRRTSPRARTSRAVRARALRPRERRGRRSPTASSPFRSIPAFASLNLAQAVALVAYEWFKLSAGGALPFAMPREIARRAARSSCWPSSPISNASSSGVEYLPPGWRSAPPCWSICATSSPACSRPSRTSRPCTASSWRWPKAARVPRAAACSTARKRQAARAARRTWRRPRSLRARTGARAGAAAAPQSDRRRAAVLGRALNDRRFAGKGFKRQVPIGPHIADFVSFPLRIVIEIVPGEAKAARRRPRERATGLARRPRLSRDRGRGRGHRGRCRRHHRQARRRSRRMSPATERLRTNSSLNQLYLRTNRQDNDRVRHIGCRNSPAILPADRAAFLARAGPSGGG